MLSYRYSIFLTPSVLWAGSLITGGYAGGCTIAAWGYFLRVFTPKNERIKSCADVLIYSKHATVLKIHYCYCVFFIFIITINSGLMYQVINPAFKHLTKLANWYWTVPYIAVLIIMRNSSKGIK